MKCLTLVLMCLLTLGLLCPKAQAQLNVYDAHGQVIGKYLPNGPALDSDTGEITTGESAVRIFGSTTVAIPITSEGFPGSSLFLTSSVFSKVGFTTNNCTGTPFLPGGSQANLDEIGGGPVTPLVQIGVVEGSKLYYISSKYFELNDQHPTICSELADGLCGALTSCSDDIEWIPATSASLNFYPPFSVR